MIFPPKIHFSHPVGSWAYNLNNNTNNRIAFKKIESLLEERHATGTGKGKVSGAEWRLDVWNARGVSDLDKRQLCETMGLRKTDILCVPEKRKRRCEIRVIENVELKNRL